MNEPKKTASYSSIHDLEEDDDSPDLYIDKLIANIQFNLDSNIVELVSNELKKVKGPQKYLELLRFDGNLEFALPEKKVEVVQEEELHIPLYVYQKSGDEQSQANNITTTNNVTTVDNPSTTKSKETVIESSSSNPQQ